MIEIKNIKYATINPSRLIYIYCEVKPLSDEWVYLTNSDNKQTTKKTRILKITARNILIIFK